ncbi:hypothetical protein CYFUS_004941 [Cystobacter fuscus]|uniref:Uncharacterized protein n=1 Tax=Cystobacter fuscus TaxID=43 RepID=A0A250J7K0_9BACT|nr:hypothetical protein [Cystobacter fuscus]ATB39497.1 hypothetical protein CYFUS_004941 [Cystobacter fuscus]
MSPFRTSKLVALASLLAATLSPPTLAQPKPSAPAKTPAPAPLRPRRPRPPPRPARA